MTNSGSDMAASSELLKRLYASVDGRGLQSEPLNVRARLFSLFHGTWEFAQLRAESGRDGALKQGEQAADTVLLPAAPWKPE